MCCGPGSSLIVQIHYNNLAGDTIKLDCWYDNSEANQPIVDGQPKQPETVGWGEGTYDEMCLGVLYVAHE